MDATLESALGMQSAIQKATVKVEHGMRGSRPTVKFSGKEDAVRDAAATWAKSRYGAKVGEIKHLDDGTCFIECVDLGCD